MTKTKATKELEVFEHPFQVALRDSKVALSLAGETFVVILEERHTWDRQVITEMSTYCWQWDPTELRHKPIVRGDGAPKYLLLKDTGAELHAQIVENPFDRTEDWVFLSENPWAE